MPVFLLCKQTKQEINEKNSNYPFSGDGYGPWCL